MDKIQCNGTNVSYEQNIRQLCNVMLITMRNCTIKNMVWISHENVKSEQQNL